MPAGEIKRNSGRVCPPGPYEVCSIAVTDVPLDLRKGERMRGRLVEEDSQDFDWAIVDGPASVDALQGEEYEFYEGGDSVTADWVDFANEDVDELFLILAVPRRQNDRSVVVDLRRV